MAARPLPPPWRWWPIYVLVAAGAVVAVVAALRAIGDVLTPVREALFEEMERDPDVLILGEDVGVDGGVFRVTEGLQQRYGDQRVFDAVTAFGGKVVMTSSEHMTGSDRIAEVVGSYHCDYVLNIQGDEPLLIPEIIDEVIIALVTDKKQVMTTSCYRITDESRIDNPSAVKVVVDIEGNAMMFSRAPIPYPRNREYHAMHEHIGVFGFRKDFLLKYVTLPNTPLSLTESLEQLKAMENGYRIKVVQTKYNYQPPSVKTPEDLEQVVRILRGSQV